MELKDFVGRYGVLNEAFKETAGKNYEMHYGHLVKVKRNYAGVFPLQVVVLSNKGKPHFDVKPNEIDLLDDNDSIIKFRVGDWYDHHFNKGVIQMIDYKYRKMELKYTDGSSEVVDVPKVNQTPIRDIPVINDTADSLADACVAVSQSMPSLNNIQGYLNTDHQLHKKLIDDMHQTYLIKNKDYGNSFAEQFNEYGVLSSVIRMDDKMRRLKQLMNNPANVKDESVIDTVQDLANYAVMTWMELVKDSQKNAN